MRNDFIPPPLLNNCEILQPEKVYNWNKRHCMSQKNWIKWNWKFIYELNWIQLLDFQWKKINFNWKRKKNEKGCNIVKNRIIKYNFSPLLQGLSKINTITILKDEIIEQHIQNWLAIFHTGFLHQQKQFTSQPVRNMPAGTLPCIMKKDKKLT